MDAGDKEQGPAAASGSGNDPMAESTAPQPPQPSEPPLPPFTLLPYELMLEIAGYLYDSTPGKDSKSLNCLSQSSHRLRQIFYPLANRHLWYDEETQFPDTLLKLVLYTFTEPLTKYVKSATFRLRKEEGPFWMGGEYDDIIDEGLASLKSHLKSNGGYEGGEIFRYFESEIDEYGMYILPTVLLYQMDELREIELAPSIHAMSSKFMLTTLHYFRPPFRLDRLGIVKLTDLAAVNYWLLERFLRLGPLSALGIDYRFGSTGGRPKIRPIPEFPKDLEDPWEPHLESDSEDDISVWSLDTEDKALVNGAQSHGNRYGDAWFRTVSQDIDEYYQGYQSAGWRAAWYPTDISYEFPGTQPPLPEATEFQIQDLRLWMDETPSIYEKLVPLLHKIVGLRRFDLNLFTMYGSPALGPIDTPHTRDFECISKLLENQKDTLESLTMRVVPMTTPHPNLPSLLNFTRLRKVHLFCTSSMVRTFKNATDEEPYFGRTIPRGLEVLRIDFCYSEFFVKKAMELQTANFPDLKVVLGILNDADVSDTTRDEIQRLWATMLYQKDPISGLWEEVHPTSPIQSDWRRKSHSHVPIQLLIIQGTQKNVWCSHEGWYGPFQEHTSSDMPWDIEVFKSMGQWVHDSDLGSEDYSRLDPDGGYWIGTPAEDM
ncbi:hypothetical protein TWF506_008790 [Arthrobotrys conoides]|uniref:Uncharacterized protein n=1 Tax=Arthrobotrys conoides TaxID=74498 RepID=A0AAN8PGI9_9PEZI